MLWAEAPLPGSGSRIRPSLPAVVGPGPGRLSVAAAAAAAMDSEFSDAEAAPGGEENAPVYCVCRKPDINCFMIGCDNCNEWFHGDCINITERMAKAIREWYCRQCREKDPSLEIRYRHKKWREKEHEGAKGQELEQGRAAKPWLSDAEDAPFLDPVLRKRAVKVKHVKRREKKSDKKKEERYKRHRQRARHRERRGHPERSDARDPAGLGQCLGPGCTRPARPPS
ncbi:CXXC-type zinc finger protein 1-like, partial [Malurus melanocephalus]|uniref:CXXC-type zinc finger protein 1-like n=1 Tax=Malurus melanocephalus TaxID=175006 RepID=UPI00254838A8